MSRYFIILKKEVDFFLKKIFYFISLSLTLLLLLSLPVHAFTGSYSGSNNITFNQSSIYNNNIDGDCMSEQISSFPDSLTYDDLSSLNKSFTENKELESKINIAEELHKSVIIRKTHFPFQPCFSI